MSKIDYQALREAAERAIPAMERLLMLPADDDLLSEQELKDYGVDIDALNAFKFLAGPETVLALLDERERNQQYIKSRDQENEDIALTVGKLRVELEAEKQRAKDLFMENARLKSGIAGLIHLGIRYADVDVMKIAGDAQLSTPCTDSIINSIATGIRIVVRVACIGLLPYVELSDGTLSWLGNALFWMPLPEPPQEAK
ncbi:ead/Ea22-like family protein [Escherichia coli]|nr:ead/Ea22-like family protein [Escherichia coli]